MLLIALVALGILGLTFTPRQEDPQISVPMVDIFFQFPGASSEQVASLATDPLERMMSEMPGVKHVYSASQRGAGMVTVEFDVGQGMETSLVKLYDKLASNMDKIPPGVSQPLVKPKAVDDVPVVTLTLWSESVDDAGLRLVALEVLQRLKEVPNTSQSFIVGGRPEEMRVEVLPERLKGFGISLDQLAKTIRSANDRRSVGSVETGNKAMKVYTGRFLRHAGDIERLIVGVRNGSPVYVRDVARVSEGPGNAKSIVQYFSGPAKSKDAPETSGAPAVTIAIAKKSGTNGVSVANAILAKVEGLKGRVIPENINIAVTRDYGKTANDKVNELIAKMVAATGAVTLLIFLFLGMRPTIVVATVIPVIILITIFSAWVLGYTIDRVSLFALIFSIGILVDDATVVVENIYRRWLLQGTVDTATTIDAVREVGNPTILATFTIVAALLPMGFVSGMMGPYMQPIPVLGSVAMLFSLLAAFVFTPWLAIRIRPGLEKLRLMEEKERNTAARLDGFFRRLLGPLLDSPFKARLFRIGIWVLFMGCCLLFYTTNVTVKMLPLDNKPEFNVVVNMPDGTALPATANVVQQMTEKLLDIPEITAVQTYAGTASPFNFNGLIRHYYLRTSPWQGDIQVQLLDKGDRKRSSHEIAVEVRHRLTPLAKKVGARIAAVEMPPGPPVLQTMVAEVYGPDDKTRRQFARDLTAIFEKAETVVDVDNYLQDPHNTWMFVVDQQKAQHRNVAIGDINKQLAMVMGGHKLGDVKLGHELEPRFIILQAPLGVRGQVARLAELPIRTHDGQLVPLSELGKFVAQPQEPIAFHKDLRSVEYVTGEVAGRLAAPVYGMIEIAKLLDDYKAPDGTTKKDGTWGTLLGPPGDSFKSGFEWTGEWTVTYETFRDMGLAFMAALILIYMLVVLEFGNFRLPGIIMAPIPLTLIGIIPGHWLLGAEFTATSMIGWIALAGIIVRNSILLVDFSKNAIQAGMDTREAVIQAVRTRTRPILITQLTMIAGSSSIITDPIFQGMAISLLFGAIVATGLTLFVIPLACVRARGAYGPAGAELAQAGAAAMPAVATGSSGSGTAAAGSSSKPKTSGPGLWSRIGGVLTMAYYLVRMPLIVAWMGIARLGGRMAEVMPGSVMMIFYAIRTVFYFIWMFIREGLRGLFGGRGEPALAGATPASGPAGSNPAPATRGGVGQNPQTTATAATAKPNRTAAAKTKQAKPTPAPALKQATATTRKSAAKSTSKKTANKVRSTATGAPKTAAPAGDDLQRINGIGPKVEIALKELGISTLHEIADWTPDDIERVGAALRLGNRIDREKWVAQAGRLAKPAAGETATRGKKSKAAAKPEKAHATSNVEQDDLREIKGIGPGIAQKLKEAGIVRFEQIAAWRDADIEAMDVALNFRGRIGRDDWVAQAKALAGTSGRRTTASQRAKN